LRNGSIGKSFTSTRGKCHKWQQAACLAWLRLSAGRGCSRDLARVPTHGPPRPRQYRDALYAGIVVHLTLIEFRLLAGLIANAGRVITSRQLVCEIWGTSYSAQTHYARVVMQHLRQKLEDDAAQPTFLLTEIGVGYRLALP
jgi:hypothetical protein